MCKLFEKNGRKDLLKPVIFSKSSNNFTVKLALGTSYRFFFSLIFGIGNFELLFSEL